MKTRILALILSVLMVATFVASCGKIEAPEVTTAATTTDAGADVTTQASTEQSDNNLDANGYWKDDLPDDIDLKGEKVTILYDNNSYAQEFVAEGITGDLINDAIYNRNETVSERLNVELNFVGVNGRNDNTGFITTVNNDVQSGAAEYDLIGTYSQLPGSLAMSGSLIDLLTLDYLNFEQPWWPATMIEQASIQDNLYLCTGDISTN